MKIICLLLSVYIIMLSTRPCCTDSDCKGITPTTVAGKNPVKDAACNGCSPFFTCGTCAGFIVAKPLIWQTKPVVETPVKTYFAYQQPYLQQVSLAIWQPPQLS